MESEHGSLTAELGEVWTSNFEGSEFLPTFEGIYKPSNLRDNSTFIDASPKVPLNSMDFTYLIIANSTAAISLKIPRFLSWVELFSFPMAA